MINQLPKQPEFKWLSQSLHISRWPQDMQFNRQHKDHSSHRSGRFACRQFCWVFKEALSINVLCINWCLYLRPALLGHLRCGLSIWLLLHVFAILSTLFWVDAIFFSWGNGQNTKNNTQSSPLSYSMIQKWPPKVTTAGAQRERESFWFPQLISSKFLLYNTVLVKCKLPVLSHFSQDESLVSKDETLILRDTRTEILWIFINGFHYKKPIKFLRKIFYGCYKKWMKFCLSRHHCVYLVFIQWEPFVCSHHCCIHKLYW